MRSKTLIIILLSLLFANSKPLRAQANPDSVIIGADTLQNKPSIMLSKETEISTKHKWEAALLIAGISLIMIVLFNARSK